MAYTFVILSTNDRTELIPFESELGGSLRQYLYDHYQVDASYPPGVYLISGKEVAENSIETIRSVLASLVHEDDKLIVVRGDVAIA
jgi:hypothetical protein